MPKAKKRGPDRAACPHGCTHTEPALLTTAGSSFRVHVRNRNLHPDCTPACNGYTSLSVVGLRHDVGNTLRLGYATFVARAQNGRPIRLLYVLPNEQICSRYAEASNNLGYLEYALERARRQKFARIPGAVFGGTKTYVFEHVAIIDFILDMRIGAKQNLVDNYWTQAEFVQQLRKSRDPLDLAQYWTTIADVIVFPIKGLWAECTTHIELGGLIESLRAIEEHVPFAPCIQEQLHDADKMRSIQIFDSLCGAQPKSAYISDPESQSIMQQDRWVLKRSWSGSSRHVEHHQSGDCPPGQHTLTPHVYHFVQEYVPMLEKAGELRVYMVAGEVKSCVGTRPVATGGLDGESVFMLPPLDVYDGETHFMDYQSLDIQESQRGMKELSQFCVDTLDKVIEIETARFGRVPSIAIVARMDVSVVERGGRWVYMVNELTRLPAMSSLSRQTMSVEVFAATFVQLLGTLVRNTVS